MLLVFWPGHTAPNVGDDPVLITVQEELGQILTEGMERERGEEIDIYFIIYFKCLHLLCVVLSLNRNR